MIRHYKRQMKFSLKEIAITSGMGIKGTPLTRIHTYTHLFGAK